MLVTLNEIMKIAEEREIAIGSFNTPNLESLEAIIRAAEELDLPVIIQFAQCHEPWIPLSLIGPIMVEAAKKAAALEECPAGDWKGALRRMQLPAL